MYIQELDNASKTGIRDILTEDRLQVEVRDSEEKQSLLRIPVYLGQ